MANPVSCPACGADVAPRERLVGEPWHKRTALLYECCGLRGWDGKPLVNPAILKARQHCHDAFDRLWQDADRMYTIAESDPDDRAKARTRMRIAARNRAYAYMADRLGLPEAEVHMSVMEDIDLMRRFWVEAKQATPEAIRRWAKARERAA